MKFKQSLKQKGIKTQIRGSSLFLIFVLVCEYLYIKDVTNPDLLLKIYSLYANS